MPAHLDKRALLVNRVSKASLVTQAHLVCQVCPATIHHTICTPTDNASGALLDHLDHLAHPAQLVLLVPKAALALPEVQARTVVLDQPAQPAPQATKAKTDLLDPVVIRAAMLPRAAKETLDPPEAKETLDLLVPMETAVALARLVALDQVDPLAPLEHLVELVNLDQKAHLARLEDLVKMPSIALAHVAARSTKHLVSNRVHDKNDHGYIPTSVVQSLSLVLISLCFFGFDNIASCHENR